MTFHFSSAASIAGNARACANEATLAMTTCSGTDEGPTVPRPFCSRGDLLFATAPAAGYISQVTELLSEKHKLDIVHSHLDPGEMMHPYRFSLGVRLFWKVLWHHDFRLWQPESGGTACFVPNVTEDQIYFWVEEGRLACDRGTPFVDLRDRARGIRDASRALARLLIDPRHYCRAEAA